MCSEKLCPMPMAMYNNSPQDASRLSYAQTQSTQCTQSPVLGTQGTTPPEEQQAARV